MTPLVAAVISTLHFEGPVTADGGDYHLVTFDVPAGVVELHVLHADGGDSEILDWGVWAPDGFRGWGGGNPEPAIIGVDESSRSYLRGPITPGTWTLVIGKAKLSGGAASYDVDVELHDAATLAPQPAAPYAPVVLAAERRWYAGDLHVHSEESGDASATFTAITDLARARGLDFVVVSDHNTISHHDRIAAFQQDVDDVLLVRGIEVTTYAGHAGAIGVAAYVDHRVGLDGVSATTIVEDVVAQGGVVSINHPTLDLGDACIGCAWDHADTPWDDVSAIELQTGPSDVTGVLFTPLAIELWDRLLDDGHRLAAVGGSDDHRADGEAGGTQSPIGSPTTMVLADALSEAALVDAIAAGRTVLKLRGPEDPMVELIARDADGEAVGLGDTVVDVGSARLEVHVTGGDGVTAELWRDGARIETAAVTGADWTGQFAYPVSGELERYRVELVDGGGRITVTSHLYVDGDPALAPPDGDDGGCGCAAGGPTAAADGAMLALVGLALWRRRRAR